MHKCDQNKIILQSPFRYRAYQRTFFIGLTKSGNELTWADGTNITNSAVLPWYSTPTYDCVQIGQRYRELKFTSLSCTSNLYFICETNSSGEDMNEPVILFFKCFSLILS